MLDLKPKTNSEVSVKKDIKKELKLINNIKPLRGHTLYEINTITGDVVKAQYIKEKFITWEQALKHMKDNSFKGKILINKDCEYISALNPLSALKRYNKAKGSATLPERKMKLNF